MSSLSGLDGTLADVIDRTDPAAGQVRAKTGTLVDAPDGNMRCATNALAGYMNSQSGRRLVFAIYVNNIPVASGTAEFAIDLALDANKQLSAIAAAIDRSS
ncbi:D-alanyl-D-alanine carboxypeptidase [Rhodococcus erythropolis]|uniref:D-alanyl-D-alanine carboxypeptidase n=1 Tax=Rhodococcus erythropolis TaxID=1833 RepID=UPI0036714D70